MKIGLRVLLWTLAVGPSVVIALAMRATVEAQSPPSLQQQLAQRTADVGRCHAELGPLQQLYAQVIAGQVREVAATEADIRKKFEAANPGKTLDVAWKVTALPAQDERAMK